MATKRQQQQPIIARSHTESARIAKRLLRQQKRLEKQMGIEGVPLEQVVNNTPVKARMVRYSDIRELEPLTDTQCDFFDAWEEDDAATGYVLFGSAGSGKTAIAIYHAIKDVLDPELPQYQKVVIVRSAVPSREIGHLPGEIFSKMEAYEAPYHSIFEFLTNGNKGAYEKLKDSSKVEFMASSFIRGITLDNVIVVVDEVQNFSWQELHSLATRVGKNCKIIFCGDGKQDDLHFKKSDSSGFRDFLEVSRSVPSFRHFKFTVDDVVRSGFVKEWILACDRLGM